MNILVGIIAIAIIAITLLLTDLFLAIFMVNGQPIFNITKRIIGPKYDIKIQNKILNESLWIKKVIDSCETFNQCLVPIDNLIDNYKKLYKNKVDLELLYEICSDLYDYQVNKQRDLI